MHASSAATHAADPYRGGLELGETLRAIHPEIIFLFASIEYGSEPDLLEGLYDALGNKNVVVIGNTGDGYYEKSGAAENGASALALNSEGLVHWHLKSVEKIADSAGEATRRLFKNLNDDCPEADTAFYFMVSDFRTDASHIEQALQDVHKPVIGGFAADDNQMKDCALFANNRVLRDAIVAVAATGSIQFDISVGNSLQPVGNQGKIEEAEGTHIFRIDGTEAMDFVERETGKPVLQSDRGITTLTIIDEQQNEVKRLRSIVPSFADNSRALGLYGGIEAGNIVQVCQAHPEDLVQEVYQIAKQTHAKGFQPKAAVIVSCAGRKWLLGDRIQHEVQALTEQFGFELSIAGFPSFGEIGPLKTASGYSRNLFHNMTYILLLVGD